MSKRNQVSVYEVYDEIMDWYDENRSKNLMELPYLELIQQHLPEGGHILDLGCGTGEPIAQYFIERGFAVTGVDGSHKMIALCEQRFPAATWIQADMRGLHLDKKFDAVIAWHSFFHLEPEPQRQMFKVFASHLKPGGILAFTSGDTLEEVWSDNGGQDLYHASLSTVEYESLLQAASFEVLVHKIRDPECGDATVWVAQRK